MVGDIKMATLDADTRPAVYLPHTQLPIGLMTFVVRTEMDPMSLVDERRRRGARDRSRAAARRRQDDGGRGRRNAGAPAHRVGAARRRSR